MLSESTRLIAGWVTLITQEVSRMRVGRRVIHERLDRGTKPDTPFWCDQSAPSRMVSYGWWSASNINRIPFIINWSKISEVWRATQAPFSASCIIPRTECSVRKDPLSLEKCHLLKRHDVSALLLQSVNYFCHLWAGHSNHHLHHRSPGLLSKHPFLQTSWRQPTPWLVPAKERGRINSWLKRLLNPDMIRRIMFCKINASWDKSCWALHSHQCPAMTYSKSSPWKVSSRRRQSGDH